MAQKQAQKKQGKNRKYGRNKVFCAQYAAQHRQESNKRRKQAKHARTCEAARKERILRRAKERLELHFLKEAQKEALLRNRMTYHHAPAALKSLRDQLIEQGKIVPREERSYKDYATAMHNPLHTQH